jgi:hypothetical protein
MAQYKNKGYQAKWKPFIDPHADRPVNAPAAHGEAGMSGLSRTFIDGVINETINMNR